MARGVVGLHHLVQRLQLGQGRGVILGALEIDPDKAADIVTQLLRVHLHPRPLDDPRLLHLLHPHMDGARADRQLLGKLGVRDTRILHQGGEDGLIEIIDPIIFRHFFALPLMISQ
ncbi:hypothetical protein D3C85_1416480 [compost metagenome]